MGDLETALPELGTHRVHLWVFESARLEPCREELHGHLLAPEREAYSRLVTEAERTRFSLYRGAVRRVLAWYEGCDPEHIVLTPQGHGKPVHAVHTPSAPDQSFSPIQFNISHSHRFCVLALSVGRPVGVDIERVRLPESADTLMDHFFLPEEAEVIVGAPQEEQAELFCRIWTRKEAAVKCFGGSLAQWIGVLQVAGRPNGCSADRADAESIFPSVIRHHGLPDLHLEEFIAGDGYRGCLCTAGAMDAVTVFDLGCAGWSLRDGGLSVFSAAQVD